MVEVVPHLFNRYVKGTENKALVQIAQVLLCNLTISVVRGIKCSCKKVYISTRPIKHVYDKRPAEEFDFLIRNLHTIVKYPDKIYKNKNEKRGKYCFVKEIKNRKYFCSLEVLKKDGSDQCEVVTFFRTQDSYLENYEVLWEWKGGKPSS